MDAPPPAPTPPTPYRAGKALAEIIPPDRRRAKAAALVVSSMVAGVALWVLGGWALELIRGEAITTPTPTPGYIAGRIGRSVLHGPGGTVTMPPARRSVVHVWLQGCADCMPAFNAMAQLESEGGLGNDVPVVNVAYGEADPTWAQRYGVARSLVFDPGGANVVRPLGIGTFTTLVVEPDGSVIHRDRPDRPGYVERVRAALLPPLESELPPATLPAQPFSDAVERVVVAHRAGIKRMCWERATQGDTPRSANINVSLTIDTEGRVSATSARGDNPVIARCIEAQTRTWLFPAPTTPTTVTIPFKFVRE